MYICNIQNRNYQNMLSLLSLHLNPVLPVLFIISQLFIKTVLLSFLSTFLSTKSLIPIIPSSILQKCHLLFGSGNCLISRPSLPSRFQFCGTIYYLNLQFQRHQLKFHFSKPGNLGSMFGMIIFVNKKMKYHWIKNAFLLVKILSVPFSSRPCQRSSIC